MNKKLFLTKTSDSCDVSKPKLTVVLIHGIAADSTDYNKAIEYFKKCKKLKEVRFVTFDLLGSGESLKDDSLNYDYTDQVEALHNSIEELAIKTPLVLVGHSMGALIATKYADTYKKSVLKLILVSAPTYTVPDLKNPFFQAQMTAFKKVVAVKDKKYINDKAFDNEISEIVLNESNYERLTGITTPTVLIYSDADQIIMPANIRKAIQDNPKYLQQIITTGTHRVARDKYSKIAEVLEEIMND